MTDKEKGEKLSWCIIRYITDVYKGIREKDYLIRRDMYDLKMMLLQALAMAACTNDIQIIGNAQRVVENIILNLSAKGSEGGIEREYTVVKVVTTVFTVIKGEVKIRKLKLVHTNAEYVDAYLHGSYLPVWMLVGARRVLQLIKLEIRRKPKYSFN